MKTHVSRLERTKNFLLMALAEAASRLLQILFFGRCTVKVDLKDEQWSEEDQKMLQCLSAWQMERGTLSSVGQSRTRVKTRLPLHKTRAQRGSSFLSKGRGSKTFKIGSKTTYLRRPTSYLQTVLPIHKRMKTALLKPMRPKGKTCC